MMLLFTLFPVSCSMQYFNHQGQTFIAESHSSVGSVVDLRTGGGWFDPQLCQYSFRGLMIVILSSESYFCNQGHTFIIWGSTFCHQGHTFIIRVILLS